MHLIYYMLTQQQLRPYFRETSTYKIISFAKKEAFFSASYFFPSLCVKMQLIYIACMQAILTQFQLCYVHMYIFHYLHMQQCIQRYTHTSHVHTYTRISYRHIHTHAHPHMQVLFKCGNLKTDNRSTILLNIKVCQWTTFRLLK